MPHLLTLITLGLVWTTLPLSTYADIENDVHGPKLVIRTPRAISGLWKRFFGRRKQTQGFQGTSQTQQPYNVAASSTYYPAFVHNTFPVLPFQGHPGFSPVAAPTSGFIYPYSAGAGNFAGFTGFETGYNPLAQASSIYPAFTMPTAFNTASAGLTTPFDFHSYFEQLARPTVSSAASTADQDTSASTLLSTAVKGDGPGNLAFKNLYSSFPFQLASESSPSSAAAVAAAAAAAEPFSMQIPFARKHTLRRMSHDKANNVAFQLQKLISQQQPTSVSSKSQQEANRRLKEQEQEIRNALFNPQKYIARIIQQELAAQQAQLQGQSIDDKHLSPSSLSSSSSSSFDQIGTGPEQNQFYQSSPYYYGGGRSLPSAMSKPRPTHVKQLITKKSAHLSPSPSTSPVSPSSEGSSASSTSSANGYDDAQPISSNYASANSYPTRVYKE